jgi:hypothetical protein
VGGIGRGTFQHTDKVLKSIFSNGSWRSQGPVALFVAFALAGCAGAGFGENNGYDAPRDMFVSGYEKIEAVYIQDVKLGDLTVAGLTQVASLDPTLAVSHEPDKVALQVEGKSRATFKSPAEGDADGWGNLAADILAAAQAVSPPLKAKTNEDIYDAFFAGALT